jgi:hypothetical protein
MDEWLEVGRWLFNSFLHFVLWVIIILSTYVMYVAL